MKQLIGFLFLTLTAVVSLPAQPTNRLPYREKSLPASDTLLLSEVTVTAFYAPQKLDNTAAAVTLLPVGKLQLPDQNIASALATLPGVVMQQGTSSTVKLTLRGIGSRYPYGTKKIKAYLDGIPLYSVEGETTFDDIAPEFLQRIELLRGPASSVYGASLGGTMILQTRRADPGIHALHYSGSVASFGTLKNTVSYSGPTAHGELLASFATSRSDGYRENNRYAREAFLVSYRHQFNPKLSGSLLLNGSTVRSQIPSSVDSATLVTNPRSAASRWLQTRGYEHPARVLGGYQLSYRIAEHWNLTASAFTTSAQTEENRPFNFLDESGISYGGRVVVGYSRTGQQLSHQLHFGSNLYRERNNSAIYENSGGEGVKGKLLQSGRQRIGQNDLFAQWEITRRPFILTAGVNLNSSGFRFADRYSDDGLDQSGRYTFDPIVAPRLALAWNPLPHLHLYGAFNHGYSIPSLSETLSPLGLINRDIRPERAQSWEAGSRLHLFGERTSLELIGYRMRVLDLIVPKRVAEDIYVGQNAGSSLHRGLEFSVQQWLWDKEGNFNAVATLNGALNRFTFEEFNDEGVDYAGKKLPGLPERQLTAALELNSRQGFYARLELIASGRMSVNDLNSSYSKGYTLLNGSAGYQLPLSDHWSLDALLRISNLANKRYVSMVVVNAAGTAATPPRYYYPGLPRRLDFSLTLRYRFRPT